MSMDIAILVRSLSNDFVFFSYVVFNAKFYSIFLPRLHYKSFEKSGFYRGTSDIGINMKYIFEMTNMSKKYLIINIKLIRQIMYF